jgi:hypothetical protein
MNLFRTALPTGKLSIINYPLSIVLCLFLSQLPLRALVTTNVSTAQALQNALTLAANNGDNNVITIAAGYYTGNFNYNSSAAYNLTISNAPGVTNTQITLDGAGTGRDMNITSSGNGTITVQGITFLRNCGNSGIGALRIAAGGGTTILVNGCQFFSPSGSSGSGLEVGSGLNATVTNCTAAGAGGNGTGISIYVTGNATVQNCTVTTNNAIGMIVSGGVVAITTNICIGNSGFDGGGAYCSGTTVRLSGNTFTGNSQNWDHGIGGGGAYCSGTTVTLFGNIFNGNWNVSEGSGGAYCSGTTLTLSGNNFTGNESDYGSGGASCDGGTLTISGNTFNGNYCVNFYENSAGGVYCTGIVTLFDNTFTGNSVNGPGGGGAECSGTVTLIGNTFTGNSTSGNGGGAGCYGTPVTLSNNTFTANSASGYGGGADCEGDAFLTLSANTFYQNSADAGGGILASGSTINILDNLLAQNSSSSGGGVWVDASSTLFMINNTIAANNSTGIGGGAVFDVTGTVELLNVYNNIIWGNSASGNGGDVWLGGTGQQKVFDFNDVDSMYGVWDIALNNIDLSPQFFDPVNGDYHIKGTSPCKAAGTTNAPGMSATDLDGNPQIVNGTVDLGCYEYTTNVTHPADLTGSWIITAAEFNAYAAAWQNGQTWTNGPNPIPANYVTRAGYLMTNGGAYYNDGSARPVNWKLIGH